MNSVLRVAAVLCLSAFLSGCADLPQSGPSRSSVFAAAAFVTASKADRPYGLIELSDASLDHLGDAAPGPRLSASETAVRASSSRIGVGDDVGITIFESAPGGLFIANQPGGQNGNFVALPAQQVDEAGNVVVPFAGSIRAAGWTPAEIEHSIEQRLRGRALEPQALVTVVNRRAASVSVLGDVVSAARFALDPSGEHLLGAVARAGGPRFPAWETRVTLQRRGEVQHSLLSDIAEDPTQDIGLEPGDTVFLSHCPRYFLALGATGQTTSLGPLDRRIPFDEARITLADALAKAGGLEDDRANARGVFVYRQESTHLLREIGSHPVQSGPTAPTVYTLDLSDPKGFFLAGRFAIHPEDVVYVSNSPSTDLAKFLALVLPAAYSAANAAAVR
jgi:polysaccharide export outer membrane protein